MPKIEIRPSVATDLEQILAVDGHYTTETTWQIEIKKEEEQGIEVNFREVRLPRAVRVEYPRNTQALLEAWTRCDGILVGLLEDSIVGYIALSMQLIPHTCWVTDLAVKRHLRRQGIGSALVLAAQEWGVEKGAKRIVLEMQSRNYPAIQMARKLGFEFCGFQDLYYANRDVGLFFMRAIR